MAVLSEREGIFPIHFWDQQNVGVTYVDCLVGLFIVYFLQQQHEDRLSSLFLVGNKCLLQHSNSHVNKIRWYQKLQTGWRYSGAI